MKAVALRNAGLDANAAAKAVGVHRKTLKRWLVRQEQGEALTRPRGPLQGEILPNARWRAEMLVRELRGLVGAESLRRSVPGLSRRVAARIKVETLRKIEEERRAASDRVRVTGPGVLRGFDAMDLGDRYALIAGDGCVPYRTSWSAVERYDSAGVVDLLERDFGIHGAPLVLRLDRAKQHQTDDVQDFLHGHHVLILHGPPYWPRYYGQLERQNREHRAWLARGLGEDLDETIAIMIEALNKLWRRGTLGWKTAAEIWDSRMPLDVDRTELRQEVGEQSARIRRHLARKDADDLAERLAIEQVLRRRGLLWRQMGGWANNSLRRRTDLVSGGLLTLTLRGKAMDGFEVQQEHNRPQLSRRAWKPGETAAGFP